jgi:hypothetical protein
MDLTVPPATTDVPLLPCIPSASQVPSTLLPEGIISSSPAWDPSSQTPGRSFEEQGDGQRPTHCHDTRLETWPPHRQIPKPAGRVNRKGGYSLEKSLQLDKSTYLEIKVR